jgi:hypothetical protein
VELISLPVHRILPRAGVVGVTLWSLVRLLLLVLRALLLLLLLLLRFLGLLRLILVRLLLQEMYSGSSLGIFEHGKSLGVKYPIGMRPPMLLQM